MTGRGEGEQGGDCPGHLGEPSLLQDVQRKTQLTLQRHHRRRRDGREKRKKTKWEEAGQIKGMNNTTVTMATDEEDKQGAN